MKKMPLIAGLAIGLVAVIIVTTSTSQTGKQDVPSTDKPRVAGTVVEPPTSPPFSPQMPEANSSSEPQKSAPSEVSDDEASIGVDLFLFENLDRFSEREILEHVDRLHENGVDISALMIELIERGIITPNTSFTEPPPTLNALVLAAAYNPEMTMEEAQWFINAGSYITLQNSFYPLTALKEPKVAMYLFEQAGAGPEHHGDMMYAFVYRQNQALFDFMLKRTPSLSYDTGLAANLQLSLSSPEEVDKSAADLAERRASRPDFSPEQTAQAVTRMYTREIKRRTMMLQLNSLSAPDKDALRESIGEFERRLASRQQAQ